MMTFKRNFMFQWLMVVLALAPALLFAYLGQFSRMMSDDYCQIAIGQELGAWDYMIYKLDTWAGSYANWFFKGAVAPLDTLLPRMTPTLIITLWLVGLCWLVFQGLAYLRTGKSRLALAVTISAFIIAATVNAFYSPQSFYWYAASTHYTLPLTLLTIYMALAVWTAQRLQKNLSSLLGIIAGGMLCFISAGASEIFIAFQSTFLTLCLLMSLAFLGSSVRRSYVLVFGVGWLATLVGLAIQLSSPGLANRMAVDAQLMGQAIRSPSALLSGTLGLTFETIGHPPAFAGFVMLMGISLLAALVKYKPVSKASKPARLATPPLWLGSMVQLLFIPILWGHTSDNPQWLGRFSSGYMIVVILNIAFILSFLVMLWQRSRIHAALQQQERGSQFLYNAMLLIAVLLFALTQFRSVHYRASSYLFISFLMLLGIFSWQMSSLISTSSARRFGWLMLSSYAIALVCIAAIVATALFGRGLVDGRILAPGAYLLVLSGLVWGACIGCLIKNYALSSQAGQVWLNLLKLGSLAMILIITMGVALGHARLIPNFQLYANEWDARHQEISDSEQRTIKVEPLTFDLADYVEIVTLAQDPANRCAERYYRVESIVVTDG